MADLGSSVETRTVRLGVIPLTDCAPVAVAREKGLFAKYGLEVEIVREPSWSNIRDKVALGALDGGHMLAGMPLSATLGLGGLGRPMVTALSLGLNGCAITVSTALWRLYASVENSATEAAPYWCCGRRKTRPVVRLVPLGIGQDVCRGSVRRRSPVRIFGWS